MWYCSLAYWRDKDVNIFIGTLEYIMSIWKTGSCHKTGPDLVHNAQLGFRKKKKSHLWKMLCLLVRHLKPYTLYETLAAYSIEFAEESEGEQLLHRYHFWSCDMRSEEGTRETAAGKKRQVGLYVARYLLKTLKKTITKQYFLIRITVEIRYPCFHWYIITAAKYLHQQSTICRIIVKCNDRTAQPI